MGKGEEEKAVQDLSLICWRGCGWRSLLTQDVPPEVSSLPFPVTRGSLGVGGGMSLQRESSCQQCQLLKVSRVE